jgi:hypothetical protein
MFPNWFVQRLFPQRRENIFGGRMPARQHHASRERPTMTLLSRHHLIGRDREGPHRVEEGWFNRILLFEDLRHKLRLNQIQLPQRCLQSRPVFIRGFAEDVLKAKGCALQEQFGIF